MNDLALLADLVKKRNTLETEITRLIERPAAIGHIGEYIAARVFDIDLNKSASAKATDGHFRNGPLKGRSVNIKWYPKREGLLDVASDPSLHYYLVLAGPQSSSMTSRGQPRPWTIDSVYLFDAHSLNDQLILRKVKRGVACSVAQELWEQAELYPNQRSSELVLSSDQRQQLALFKVGTSDG
jgi:hypothetical protein